MGLNFGLSAAPAEHTAGHLCAPLIRAMRLVALPPGSTFQEGGPHGSHAERPEQP
jgi:hypothetical protein